MNTATVVPMTKARAGEILYEALKKGVLDVGGVSQEEELLLTMQFKDDFASIGVSAIEVSAFIQFLKDDVNESLTPQ